MREGPHTSSCSTRWCFACPSLGRPATRARCCGSSAAWSRSRTSARRCSSWCSGASITLDALPSGSSAGGPAWLRFRQLDRRKSPIRIVDRLKSAVSSDELASQLPVLERAQVRHAGGVEAIEQSAGLGRPAGALTVLEMEGHHGRLEVDHLDTSGECLIHRYAIELPGIHGPLGITV